METVLFILVAFAFVLWLTVRRSKTPEHDNYSLNVGDPIPTRIHTGGYVSGQTARRLVLEENETVDDLNVFVNTVDSLAAGVSAMNVLQAEEEQVQTATAFQGFGGGDFGGAGATSQWAQPDPDPVPQPDPEPERDPDPVVDSDE